MSNTRAVILSILGPAGAGTALAATEPAAGHPTWEYAVLAVVIAVVVLAVTTCCRRMASPHRP